VLVEAGVEVPGGSRLSAAREEDWGEGEDAEDRLGPKAFLYTEDKEDDEDEEEVAGAAGEASLTRSERMTRATTRATGAKGQRTRRMRKASLTRAASMMT
jgi:hypothetical protein